MVQIDKKIWARIVGLLGGGDEPGGVRLEYVHFKPTRLASNPLKFPYFSESCACSSLFFNESVLMKNDCHF